MFLDLLIIISLTQLIYTCTIHRECLSTLDDEQKESCEGLLTVEECKEALKNFSKNKSQGTDGLTADFYSFFLGSVIVHNGKQL